MKNGSMTVDADGYLVAASVMIDDLGRRQAMNDRLCEIYEGWLAAHTARVAVRVAANKVEGKTS